MLQCLPWSCTRRHQSPSNLIIGDYDRNRFIGEINFNRLVFPSNWTIDMNDASVNDIPFNFGPTGPRKALIDSSGVGITTSLADLILIKDLIPGATIRRVDATLYILYAPCDAPPVFDIAFGGIVYQ